VIFTLPVQFNNGSLKIKLLTNEIDVEYLSEDIVKPLEYPSGFVIDRELS
jgi:hypothetical protein